VPRTAGEGRESVVEHHHVVIAFRHLGQPTERGRAQRAQIRRWLVRAALPVRCDHHFLPGERVPPHLRGRADGGKVPGVDRRPPLGTRNLVVVGDSPAVGKPSHRLLQRWPPLRTGTPTSSPTWAANTSRACSSSPSSLISTSASDSAATVEIPTVAQRV